MHPPSLSATDVLFRFDSTETIVVYAGRAKKEFLVYKNVLSSSSSRFFNGMLFNDWGETCEKRFSYPRRVLNYLGYTYTGCTPAT